MRRVVASASLPQDVCVFCATRIQNAFANAPPQTQRRLFAGTHAVRKPPLGPAAGVRSQDPDENKWATWFPPAAEVYQPPPLERKAAQNQSLARGRQAEGDSLLRLARYSRPKKKTSGDLDTQRPRASGTHSGRSPAREWNREDHLANFRATGSNTPYPRYGENENIWQGLRRRTPPTERWESNWRSRSQDESRRKNHYANVGQLKQLEASKQGGYVGLGGTHKHQEWASHDDSVQYPALLQGLDTKSYASPRLADEGPAATSEAATFRSETRKFPPTRTFNFSSEHVSDYSLRLRVAASSKSQRLGEVPIQGQPSLGNTDSSSAPTRTTETSTLDNQEQDRPRRRYQQHQVQHETIAPSSRRSEDPRKSTAAHRRTERKREVGRRYTVEEDESEMYDEEFAEKRAARKRKMQRAKERESPTLIFLPEFIRVSNLTVVLKVRPAELLRKMEELGFEGVTHDHVLDAETAGLVATEYNFEPIVEQSAGQDLGAQPPIEDNSNLPSRPPVVTIMGHVDHGKTTLLDYLRKSSVAASEHGGITQHIGAFSVPMSGGRLVTFLDTPGHAAFLAMRQRGANVTDIVILVVAADDSVMAQTIEAIKHAQSAKVPIIVAVNKIDKEDARPEKVKQDLARYGIEIEDFGGDTQVVCVSGKTGQGMAELEDATVALADILDMRAPTDGLVEGWVLEGLSKKAGRVATILVRRGTLRPGDVIVAGNSWARVRSLRNEADVLVDSAGPGTPVAVDGWREQPTAGDEVLQTPNNSEHRAKSVIEYRLAASQQEQLAKDINVVNEARQLAHERHILEKAEALAAKETKRALRRSITQGINAEPGKEDDATTTSTAGGEGKDSAVLQQQDAFFILKADVSGSVEAVANSVAALGNAEIRACVLRSGVGPITEFDVEHAAAAKGHIINFNNPIDGHMARMAEERGVQVLDQSIIYRLIDQVKGVLEAKLPRLVTKRVVGEAEIAQVFDINMRGRLMVPVAGCRVRNGEIGRRGKVRVSRKGEVVYDGTLSSLKNVKKDITEARKGMECGMGFEGWTDFKVGDQVQMYEEKSEMRKL